MGIAAQAGLLIGVLISRRRRTAMAATIVGDAHRPIAIGGSAGALLLAAARVAAVSFAVHLALRCDRRNAAPAMR